MSHDHADHTNSQKNEITDTVLRMGKAIYESYLSPESETCIRVDDSVLTRIETCLNLKTVDEDLFTTSSEMVRNLLQKTYFDKFKKTIHYSAALVDMGLITLSMEENSTFGGEESSNDRSSNFGKDDNVTIFGYIYESEMVSDGLTTHRVYKLDCNETCHSTGTIKSRDNITRRYIHFAKFHKILREKVDSSFIPDLPSKKLLMTEEDFRDMEIRLNIYLKSLSNPSIQRGERIVYYLLSEFLQPCSWNICEIEIRRKFCDFKNPVKKTVLNSLIGGLFRQSTSGSVPSIMSSFSSVNFRKSDDMIHSDQRDSVAIDYGAYKFDQDDGNIPLRIILLFADEIFDLKTENRWLRRRMVVLFREVIRATYGDTINKKIVDQMRWLVSREQIVVYLKAFRDSFWPGGVVAENAPPRDIETKMRTRVVTRCKLLSSIPDEVKTLVGQHSVKRGITLVFNMFQIPMLNRRLAYVLIERFVDCLFQNPQIMNSLFNFHCKNKL